MHSNTKHVRVHIVNVPSACIRTVTQSLPLPLATDYLLQIELFAARMLCFVRNAQCIKHEMSTKQTPTTSNGKGEREREFWVQLKYEE